jgi:hypothetical protein
MITHNLGRGLQMAADPPSWRDTANRAARWTFHTLATLRHRVLQRAGRLTRPEGTLTLTMSGNEQVRADVLHYLHPAARSRAA